MLVTVALTTVHCTAVVYNEIVDAAYVIVYVFTSEIQTYCFMVI